MPCSTYYKRYSLVCEASYELFLAKMQNNLIRNVVSTAFFGENLDLPFLARRAINIEYNPRKFTAAIMRLRNPKTTVLIFNNGKIVCTGGNSIEVNKRGARIAARRIQKLYATLSVERKKKKKIRFCNYKVQNIVGSFSVGFKIDLIAFDRAKGRNSFYEPTIFPGLKFRPFSSERTTVLIFVSGKIVITGVKDPGKLYEAKDYVSRLLLRFKRPFPYTTL